MGSGFLVFAFFIIAGSFIFILSLIGLQIRLSMKDGYLGLIIPPLSLFINEPFQFALTGIEVLSTGTTGGWTSHYEGFVTVIPTLFFLLIFLCCKQIKKNRI